MVVYSNAQASTKLKMNALKFTDSKCINGENKNDILYEMGNVEKTIIFVWTSNEDSW